MARTRKTIEVDRVRELANQMLELSSDLKVDQRHGIAHLLEAVLHETGNYRGFGYTAGHPHDAHKHGDESRRRYY